MKSAIARKTLKIILWISGVSVFLLIILYFFIQSETFNKLALDYTLKELNSTQNIRDNDIYAESIDGNILNGIKLHNGSVTVKSDTILSFKYLQVKYNLWGLLDKRIMLQEVILNEPVFITSKIASGDSLIWNFENLFTSEETDTTSSPFDWDVMAENVKIENGFIRFSDDTLNISPRWKEKRNVMDFFDFGRADVSDLDLELSAKYLSDFKSINIKSLSFNTNSSLNVKNLRLNANINQSEMSTDLWDLELITDRVCRAV
jgi:hypothetical protein